MSSSDQVEFERQTGGCSGRVCWLDGEEFAKILGLSVLQGVLG